MFCPECEGEFREGIESCPDCQVALLEELPEAERDHGPFVTVFETAHPDVLPLAQSLLDEAGIPFTVKGEETFGLFPATGVGLAIDPGARAAQILVTEGKAARARELLAELEDEPD